MINFPDSPTTGQIFTSGSTSWIYDGIKWGLNTNIAVSNDSMPVGAILWYANTSTAPLGWIPADGSAVSRTTYATLFVVIGTTYGSGDGSTTFNVPSVAATTGKYYIRYTTSLGTVTTTSLSTSPVGTMLDWPTTSSYPTGYLRADGTAVSRTSYADLFALIGTTYGTGDGSTTFNLPNLVAAGSGSPVKIIKASLGGIVEPSTVAHAASHAAGGSDVVSITKAQVSDFNHAASHIRDGSDIIDADRSQIDFVPSYYTRDSSPAQAGATTDLTAHLKGIDNRIRAISNVKQTNVTATSSYTNTSYADLTPMTVNITPIFTSSKVLITVNLNIGIGGFAMDVYFRLMRGGTQIGGANNSTVLAASFGEGSDHQYLNWPFAFTFLDSPATTSVTTYKVQALCSGGGTYYLNRRAWDNAHNTNSTITVQEVLV